MPRDYLPRFALGPAEYAGALDARQTFAVAFPCSAVRCGPTMRAVVVSLSFVTRCWLPQYTQSVWHGLPDVALSRQSQCIAGGWATTAEFN